MGRKWPACFPSASLAKGKIVADKVRLTKHVVAQAQPAEREYTLWDNRIAGFGLRVRPSGAKSFCFQYRTPGGRGGKSQRVTIKVTNPDVAFAQAKALAAQHHGGADPAGEKAQQREKIAEARNALTVAAVLERFVADHAREKLADKTADEYDRIVRKILAPRLGSTKVDELKPKSVAEMYHDMRSTPTQASLAVRVLSSAMSWAEEFGLRSPGPNPARIRLKGSRRRQRLFSETEVARLLEGIDALEKEKKLTPTVSLGIRLLFATGCRASEICQLRWSNVDLAEGLMRWPSSKTGYLEKPITADARALFRKAGRIEGVDWVCPAATLKMALRIETLEAGFERVMKHANVVANENASLHLIRHWFASKIYSDPTIPLPVQMAVVGHSSVATAARYSHVTREQVRKAASDAARRRSRAVRAAAKSAAKDGRVAPPQGEKR